jgi:quinol monooxygenase YgiN
MAGTVHIPFYATLFRGDKLADALAELAPMAMRYGASSYSVQRNRDDRYKILFQAAFEDKAEWARFWESPEFEFFRAANSSYYQVPLVYTWNDVLTEGYFGERPTRSVTGNGGAVGDVA